MEEKILKQQEAISDFLDAMMQVSSKVATLAKASEELKDPLEKAIHAAKELSYLLLMENAKETSYN